MAIFSNAIRIIKINFINTQITGRNELQVGQSLGRQPFLPSFAVPFLSNILRPRTLWQSR